MPQYEYEGVEDGHVVTLLRPMSAADEPVEEEAVVGTPAPVEAVVLVQAPTGP